jgi:hypothetical protein
MATTSKKTEQTEEEKVDDLIEAVASPIKRREQIVRAGAESPYAGFERTYVQQKLSFFGKLEFIRLASRAINKAMGKGEDGEAVDLGALMNGFGGEGTQAEMFIMAVTRLAEFAPEIIKDIYMISLNVPAHERPVVAAIFDEPYDEDTETGGLSDEDGIEILKTFVEQNGRVMRDFFLTEMPKIGSQISEALSDPASTPAPSKPSKRSARNTR